MDEELDVPLPTRRATRRLGAAIGRALAAGDIVFLEGALGAGKTFLVRAIARALGIPSSVPIQSPTFALVHEHPLDERRLLVHADLYRLQGARELAELGLGEAAGAILCVEWGDRFRAEIAPDAAAGSLLVTLSLEPRRARLEGRGPRGRALVRAVGEALATPVGPG
jgi:tRNA threonylcarbamoyladenosine biosynthesis protein TsaE